MSTRWILTPRATLTIAAVALALLAVPVASADETPGFPAEQEAKLAPEEVAEKDEYAHALDLDAEHLALGNQRGGDGGQVYVYERTPEGPEHAVTLESPASDARFGTALALEGDRLLVGASGATVDGERSAGLAYLYELSDQGDWELAQTLAPPEPAARNGFGKAVALDGELIAVGAPEDEVPGETASNGAVHVFAAEDGAFEHQAKVLPPDDGDRERMGYAVEVEDGTVYAGAPNDAHEDADTDGAVYTIEKTATGWQTSERILPTEDSEAENFGFSLDVEQDTLVVGAPGPRAQICCGPLIIGPSGDAFVFTATEQGWDGQHLQPWIDTAGSAHGLDVAVDGDRVFVGAPAAPHDEKYGTVSVFEPAGDTWRQTGQIVAEDGEKLDQLGFVLAADEGLLLASAPWKDTQASRAGAVYAFAEAETTLSVPEDPTQMGCWEPHEGVEVCDEDESPDPEEVHVSVSEDGVGAVDATYIDRSWGEWTLRYLEVHVDPADGSPLGENETHLSATCWEAPDDELPCNEASAELLVSDERWDPSPPARVDADCAWLSTAPPSLCGSLRVRGQLDVAGTAAKAQLTCGGGFWSQCPEPVRGSADVDTGEDDQSVSVRVDTSSAGVCLSGDLVDQGCLSIP